MDKSTPLLDDQIAELLEQSFVDSDADPDSDDNTDPAEQLIQKCQDFLNEWANENNVEDPAEIIIQQAAIRQEDQEEDFFENLIIEEEVNAEEYVAVAAQAKPTVAGACSTPGTSTSPRR